ncbi:MAG TPA: cobyrinate a,c-diamide synthase [Actinomycetales bacterium]
MSVPRVVVAAPGSGHGKTTVATGLMAALRRRGLAVSGHKVGPDYIDPGYHALATGRPGRNVDPFLQGEHRVVPLFLHGAATPAAAQVAVVEGVMGLFDGVVGGDGFASTAHVAALLQAPVVLVLDASATGRSAAATVHGFATFDPSVRLGGVVLNKIGSDRHERELRSAVEATGVPVLGALRRDDAVGVPSRHLGLVPAAERDREALDVVDRLAAVVEAGVDVDAVLALARSAPDLVAEPWSAGEEVTAPPRGASRPVVAVAGGAAFTFSYTETTELLAAAGLDVAVLDPLRDTALPAGAAALVFGGGFPEVHAEALSRNDSLRAEVKRFADHGGTVVAECAGLLYLARELDGHAMCGVLPAAARMSPRLSLGYRSAVALTSSPLSAEGERVTGHEFHRTVVAPRSGAPAWGWSVDGAPVEPEGFATPTLHASYLHVHWAGHPAMAGRLAARLHEAAA